MNIQPQFSGVYLKPANNVPLKPSPTWHGYFDYDGKSYYTTKEDTVTLHRTRQDSKDKDSAELTDLYSELAAQVELAPLAYLAASKVSNMATIRTLPQRVLNSILPDDRAIPKSLLKKRELAEIERDAVEIGLNSLEEKPKRRRMDRQG